MSTMQQIPSDSESEHMDEVHIEMLPKPTDGYSGSTQIEEGIPPYPERKDFSIYRYVRHRLFDMYKRLFTTVFILNFAAAVWICFEYTEPTLPNLARISIPVAVNLFVTVLFRLEDFINLLYLTVLWFPLSLPLRLRRLLARVYQFGGIHSGSGVACTLWALVLCVQITRGHIEGQKISGGVVALAIIIQVLLFLITVSAQPVFRRLQHNTFEAIHRFFGWTSLILFWALMIAFSNDVAKSQSQTLAYALFTSPSIYFLLFSTLIIITPWLRLRRITILAHTPSKHLTRFYLPGRKAKPTQTIRLSTSPLTEWHSFAILPPTSVPNVGADPVHNDSISVLVSSAGDWTNSVIADGRHRRTYWIRGVPTTGVTAVAQLFHRVVVVCTGSGIGPCLSLMALANRPGKRGTIACRLVWSTQAPEATYGPQVLKEVYDSDPEAIVWDTRADGRPNLVSLAWETYKKMDAEAVVVVSNQKVTQKVVYGLESVGVPAYGPVFDS